MRRRGRSYGSCRTWPAISRLSGRLRSWINKRRPRAIRRRRQRCRKRNGNYLLVSQKRVRRAASRLPLVGRGGTAALRRSKTKTHYEGKPTQSGGADCLPLVGPRKSKSNQKGDPCGGVASLPPPGSLFNENMLVRAGQTERALSPLALTHAIAGTDGTRR